MTDIYDDPDINIPTEQYPEQKTIELKAVNDTVRGRILSLAKVNTKFGNRLKYVINGTSNHWQGQAEDVLWVGDSPKNLKAQMLELRPRPGDVIRVTLIELRPVEAGTAKLFDVEVESRGGDPLPPPRRDPDPFPAEPVASAPPANGPQAPTPSPGRPRQPTQVDYDEEDMFDE